MPPVRLPPPLRALGRALRALWKVLTARAPRMHTLKEVLDANEAQPWFGRRQRVPLPPAVNTVVVPTAVLLAVLWALLLVAVAATLLRLIYQYRVRVRRHVQLDARLI